MLCLDTTVFGMTLAKTIQMRHITHNGLLLVLFRDGTFTCTCASGLLLINNRKTRRCHVLRVSAPLADGVESFLCDSSNSILVVAGIANILTFLVSSIHSHALHRPLTGDGTGTKRKASI